MMLHKIYQCPKCLNILLVSNKMLHDLRCTYENPATYENILKRQNQLPSNNQKYPRTVESSFNKRSFLEEPNMKKKEEYIELRYEPQENQISKKKSDNLTYSVPINGLNYYDEYNDDELKKNFSSNYDNNNNTCYEMKKDVEVKKPPSIIIKTAEPQEIVYHAPAKYDPHITINKPIEETVINSQQEISDEVIIRNTLTMPENSSKISDFQNNISMSGFNYSKKNGKNENSFKQIPDISNLENYNLNLKNQFNMEKSHKNYNPFQTQINGKKNNVSKNGINWLPKKKSNMGDFDYYSYDYQF